MRSSVYLSSASVVVGLALAGTSWGTTITVESDATTLAAALANTSSTSLTSAQLAQLNTGNTTGLTFVPVEVGSFGTFTSVPTGAPSTAEVVNIPPGDGESGFFETTFTLSAGFTGASLSGAANVDDFGVVFLNGNALTATAPCSGANCVSEYGNTTFATTNQSFFKTGVNTLLIADDNTGGPSGAAFFATITTAVPEPDTYALALFGLGLMTVWTRRRSAI
jgi:hypothetical protein